MFALKYQEVAQSSSSPQSGKAGEKHRGRRKGLGGRDPRVRRGQGVLRRGREKPRAREVQQSLLCKPACCQLALCFISKLTRSI